MATSHDLSHKPRQRRARPPASAGRSLRWAAMLVGWPATALATYRWLPAPAGWYRHLLTDGIGEPRVLLHTAIIAGWLLWTWLAYELVGTVRRAVQARGHRRRWRPPTPRYAAAALVGGTVLLADTLIRAGTAMAGPPAPATTSTPPVPQPRAHPATTLSPTDEMTGDGQHAQDAGTRPTTTAVPIRAAERGPATDGCGDTHTVVRGESLWTIAERCLDDGDRWPQIWRLNKNRSWPAVSGRTRLTNPNVIYPRWTLRLPVDGGRSATTEPGAPADPATQPDLGPQVEPSPPTPAPTTSSSRAPGVVTASPGLSATPTTVTRTSSPGSTPTGHDDGVAAPPTGAAVDPSPTVAGRASAPRSTPPGISLPGGGWVDAGLAAAVVAVAMLVWRRRRHRYRPTPITSPTLDDADLMPPLGALTHLRQRLRRQVPDLLDHELDDSSTDRGHLSIEAQPPLAPVGPADPDVAGAAPRPIASGAGLAGPGALDVARALLVAALTFGRDGKPDARGQAIVPAATLDTLLDGSLVDLGHLRGLTVPSSLGDALALVEEEIVRRHRLTLDRDDAHITALSDTGGPAETLPRLQFVADVPDEAWHPRLATVIRLGAAVDVDIALIGEWPHGTTLTVATDGSTTGDGEVPRVAALNIATATDILALLREAGDHGDSRPRVSHQPADVAPGPPPAPQPVAGHTAGPATRAVQARVLGTPTILGADGQPVRGLRAKSRELLVYLVVNRRGASLDDIMEALWGDATVRRASERLSTCVANLRGVIRAVAQPENLPKDTREESNGRKRPQLEPVVNTGGHYHLDPTLVHVDWWTVLDEYAEVAAAADDDARLQHLHEAITHIRGGLADSENYDWIDTDREHARRRIINTYAHAAALLAETDAYQARMYSDLACQFDPLSEELARFAMQAAARLGDRAAISERLTILRRELDEAGIECDPDTEALAARLLRDLDGSSPEAPAPPDIDLARRTTMPPDEEPVYAGNGGRTDGEDPT